MNDNKENIKIISWNCKSKIKNILSNYLVDKKYDVVIIQEMLEPNNADIQYIEQSEYSLLDWNGRENRAFRQRQRGIGILIRDEIEYSKVEKLKINSASFKGIDINEQLQYTYSYFAVNDYRICAVWTTKNENKCPYLTCAGQLSFLLETIKDDINDEFVLIGDFNLKSVESFDHISKTLSSKGLVDIIGEFYEEEQYTYSNSYGTNTRIDYIFTDKSNCTDAKMLDHEGKSDHRALYLELLRHK